MAYTRHLGGQPLPYEIQIVRLPANEVIFDALLPDFGASCRLYVDALAAPVALLHLSLNTSDSWIHRRIAMTLSTEAADLDIILDRTDDLIAQENSVTSELWTGRYNNTDFRWHTLEPSNDMPVAWQAPAGTVLYDVRAAASSVFFSTETNGRYYDVMVWDAAAGSRMLIEKPNDAPGGACCLATDGTDMVWLEGSGYQSATQSYSDVTLVHSPFATSPQDLDPRELRAAVQHFLLGTWAVVGGGYALHVESGRPDDEERHATLTRLGDGAYWEIVPRAGFAWGHPLYVDAQEFALVEGAGPEVTLDASLTPGESYTVLRYSIDSLGAPKIP